MNSNPELRPPPPRPSVKSLFFGGLLPIILYTVIEDQYGVIAGLIAGLVFGVGELIYEKVVHKKISKITWTGNILLIVFGIISLITADGIWFKLQPAIMELLMTVILWGSLILKRSLFATLAEAQGVQLPEPVKHRLNGITFRSGIFFLLHAGLAVWAALSWTTTQWALLKGLGLTISFVIYLVAEAFYLRWTMQKNFRKHEFTENFKNEDSKKQKS